jgi:hypothetical protein
MDVPSGSIRKSGGEPGEGAGGPSSTKHAICKSREGRLAPSEEINVTPARSRVITEIAPPWLSLNSDLGASANPAFSRYQRTDLSISDTNRMTLGVVGAAIVHGPSSASARRENAHSINRNKAKNSADVDGYPFGAMLSCGPGCDLGIGRVITSVGRQWADRDRAGSDTFPAPRYATGLTLITFETSAIEVRVRQQRGSSAHTLTTSRSRARPRFLTRGSVRPGACRRHEPRPPKKERRPSARTGREVSDANRRRAQQQIR